MIGSATNRLLAKRGVPGAVALRAGLFLSATACCGVLVLVLSLFGQPPLALLMPLLVANCCSLGLVSSNATAAALQPFGAMAGVAAALGGSIQGAVAGGVSTALVGIVGLPGLGAMMAAASLTALWLRALILRRSPA